MPTSDRRPGRGDWILAALPAAAALLLAGRGLMGGLPAFTEEATPLRMALGFWGGDRGRLDLDPHFYNYPSLTFYFHFVLQGVAGLAGLVTGAWHSLAGFQSALVKDVVPFVKLARWANALVAAATVLPVYRLGWRLGGRWSAVIAAWLLAVSPLLAAQARIVGPDVPMAFCVAVALLRILDVMERGGETDYRAAGIWIGLAVSAKYPAILLVVPLAAAHGAARRGGFRLLARAGVAAVVAFALTSPFVILNLPEAVKAMSFERFHMATGHFGGGTGLAAGRYLADILPRVLGWPGMVVALAALAWFLAGGGVGRPVALYALAGLILLGSWRVAADRYLLLVLPAIPALSGAVLVGAEARLRRRGAARAATAALALLLVVPGAARSWGEGTSRARPTTRAAAARWVRENVPAGRLIAAERYSIEGLTDSAAVFLIPFDSVQPHLYDKSYSLPFYAPFDYFVLVSGVYNRYMTRLREFPAQGAFYDGIARDCDQVAAFEPGEAMAGSTIRVFKRHPGPPPADFRHINPAAYEALTDKSAMGEFLVSLGGFLYRHGRADLAMAAAEQSVVLRPDDPRSLTNLAVMHGERGDYLAALKLYTRALEIAPGDAVLNYNIGRLYEAKGLYSEGAERYATAVAASPRFAEAELGLARCQVGLQQPGAARVTLERFLSSMPDHRLAPAAREMLETLGAPRAGQRGGGG